MSSNKLKILEMFGEPITYGGQESVVYNMLSSFNFDGCFVIDLFTPYYADNKALIEFVESHDGKVYSLGLPFKTGDNRFKLTNSICYFFRKIAIDNNKKVSSYDVVHIHTGSLATMCVYAKAAKKHCVKKVIVHSHIAGFNPSIFNKIRRYIFCRILKKYVDVLFGCSDLALESKFSKDCLKDAIVIYNGIDIDKFKFNDNYRIEIRNEFGINDKFVIGSLGRINKQKNIEFLIDIFAEVITKDKNCILMIVGSGDTNYENYLKDKVYNLALDDYIIWAGNKTEPFKYYQAFDVFVLPSHFEGLPVTSIEAQVAGLPTLISDKVTKECCISSGTKYLPIDDPKIWATEILKIKEQVDFAKKNGKARLDFDIDYGKFDRNNTFKIVEKMYLTN